MVQASDLVPISIRGRFAFALTCLEMLADHFRLRGEYFRDLVHLHWEFTSRHPLVGKKGEANWFREVEELRGNRWEDLAERLRYENPDVSSDQIHAIGLAFENLYAIAGRDMYVEPQVGNTIAPSLNVASILMQWGVSLPLVEPFARSRWGEKIAFGQPRSQEFFRSGEEAEAKATADGRS